MLAPNAFVRNRYLIVRSIGGGDTSAVYEAIDINTRTNVALKQVVVGAGAGVADARRDLFEREARLLAGLRHPALPAVSDSFIDGDSEFMVAAFVPGDDLATLMVRNGRPFASVQVLRWADQLLDALDYMHTQLPPVIHRDVKPQNLKLTPRGQIMLLDFGPAKIGAAATRARPAGEPGSPFQFVAPEQIQGAGADERSDLFGLAATLYYLLTGALPELAGKRANAIARGQADPLPPAHEVNPQVPAAVSAVLAQAMAIDPAARPASATAMRAALERARLAPAGAAAPRAAPPTAQLVLPELPSAHAARLPPTDQAPALRVELPPTIQTPAAGDPAPAAPAPPTVQIAPASQLAAATAPGQSGPRWLAPAIGRSAIIVGLLLMCLVWRWAAGSLELPAPTAPAATSVAVVGASAAPARAPTDEPAAAPTRPLASTRPPAPAVGLLRPSATAVEAQPTAVPVAPPQAIDVAPTSVFAGALPILLTVHGSNLDRARVVQFVAGGAAALPAEVQTRAGDLLKLSIPALPEPIKGEVNYALQIDGVVQHVPAITLRDFRERKPAHGVLADYSYTNRVASDAAGTYTGLRSEPDVASTPVGTLRNGDQVDVLRDDVTGWYHVRISASGDQAQVGVAGWVERWLIDNQGAPAAPPTPTPVLTPPTLVFVGRVYSRPTDAAVRCGAAFESSIYGSVENSSGKGIAGAVLRVVSADGRNRYSVTTRRGGVYTVGGLGCTTWTIRLISVPGSAIQANAVTVKNLNGGRFTSAEVRYKLQ